MITKSALVAILMLGFGSSAMAQSCLGRSDFDVCMQNILGRQQAALAQSQQQTFQTYLQEFGPMLQQQYPAYANRMSFQQFAYWMMMTANGTNVQGALDAQQRQFAGLQAAHQTVMQGYNDYNAGMAANSNRSMAAVENYDRVAVRGNTLQVDPVSGQTVELPYSNVPYNQPFSYGGRAYVSTQQGYYTWNGNGWQPMQSAQ